MKTCFRFSFFCMDKTAKRLVRPIWNAIYIQVSIGWNAHGWSRTIFKIMAQYNVLWTRKTANYNNISGSELGLEESCLSFSNTILSDCSIALLHQTRLFKLFALNNSPLWGLCHLNTAVLLFCIVCEHPPNSRLIWLGWCVTIQVTYCILL